MRYRVMPDIREVTLRECEMLDQRRFGRLSSFGIDTLFAVLNVQCKIIYSSAFLFLDSSMVEHSAVNRGVVGSSPTRGVFILSIVWCIIQAIQHFLFEKTSPCRKHSAASRQLTTFGSLVKRLRHRPFTAVTRVRFP